MKARSIIYILTLLSIVLSSCVAKKKYLEMEAGRLSAEQKVRDLTAENNAKAERLKVMIADFETLKSELLGSNAIKDQYIETLNKEIFSLKSNVNQTSESLEEKNYAFEFEKRRLNSIIQERDARIKTLEADNSRLDNLARERLTMIEQGKFDIKEKENELKVMEGLKNRQEELVTNLQGKASDLQKTISGLQAQMEDKNAEILKLSNQVKLLKSQIGQ